MIGFSYHCRGCDVYGVGRSCWSCGTWHTAVLGERPFLEGSPQVHTYGRTSTTCLGRIIDLEPIDRWEDVIG